MTECLNLTRRTMLAGAVFASASHLFCQARLLALKAVTSKPTAAAASRRHCQVGAGKGRHVAPASCIAHTQKAEVGPEGCRVHPQHQEKKIIVDDAGTEVHAMTFNRLGPGPMMVVHQDDYVELTLINPEDQHASAQHRFPLGHRCLAVVR